MNKSALGFVVAGIGAFIALMIVLSSVVTVETQERAVVTKFGAVQGTLEEGLHFVNPFTTNVTVMDVSVKAVPVTELAYSNDSQIVGIEATVEYRLDPSSVETVFRDVKRDYESVYLSPKTKQAIKDVFAKYTAQGIIDNRAALPAEIQAKLVEALQGNGLNVSKVSITNIDFDDDYEAAVQNKQVEEQKALTQKNVTAQEEEKKKQEILKAEALAEKTRLEVQALASQNGTAIIEKIKAEANLEAAKRWNGQLPVNMYGSAPLPLINVGQ